MRVIALKSLRDFWEKHESAQSPLKEWYAKTVAARWEHLMDTRRTFPHADQVIVASGGLTTVFNIGGNRFRLITAVHYNTSKVFVLRVLTHADYEKGTWKDQL